LVKEAQYSRGVLRQRFSGVLKARDGLNEAPHETPPAASGFGKEDYFSRGSPFFLEEGLSVPGKPLAQYDPLHSSRSQFSPIKTRPFSSKLVTI